MQLQYLEQRAVCCQAQVPYWGLKKPTWPQPLHKRIGGQKAGWQNSCDSPVGLYLEACRQSRSTQQRGCITFGFVAETPSEFNILSSDLQLLRLLT